MRKYRDLDYPNDDLMSRATRDKFRQIFESTSFFGGEQVIFLNSARILHFSSTLCDNQGCLTKKIKKSRCKLDKYDTMHHIDVNDATRHKNQSNINYKIIQEVFIMVQTQKKETKAKAEKVEMDRSYFGKLRQNVDALGQMIDAYKSKYLGHTITAGKELADGVKEDSRVIFENVILRGKPTEEEAEKAAKETEPVAKTKSTEETPSAEEKKFCPRRMVLNKLAQISLSLDEYKGKYASNTTAKTGVFVKAVKNDTRKIVDDVSDGTQKVVRRQMRLREIRETIDHSVEGALSYINLPQKQDIERLNQALENLSAKVDHLSKEHSA